MILLTLVLYHCFLRKLAIYMETTLTLLNTQPVLSQQAVELQVVKLENSLASLYETIKQYRRHQV